jgi:hypothetical protein
MYQHDSSSIEIYKLNSNGRKHKPLPDILKLLNTEMTTAYTDGYLGNDLRQAGKCGGLKQLRGIHLFIS